ARLAKRDDTRSPLKDEPGWATHTTNQNFCKSEYFHDEGLTGQRNRAGVLPDRQSAGAEMLRNIWELLRQIGHIRT
ncbi:hypothetical protein, partial [Bradyrhizobium diazoefficiens]